MHTPTAVPSPTGARGLSRKERGLPMITLLGDGYQYVRTIEPGRALKRVERGDAEWVTASGVAPDLRYGTIRMITPRRLEHSSRPDVLLILAADGVPVLKLTARDRKAVQRRLQLSDRQAQDHGGCIILSRPVDAALREGVIMALSAVATDEVARFARLRVVVQNVLRRAGAERSTDLDYKDLSHIAKLLARELRQDMSIAEVLVELQRLGRLLGPDRAQIRELAAEVQYLTLRPRQRQHEDPDPSLLLADGNHRAGHGGGRQSVTTAQARAAADGQ